MLAPMHAHDAVAQAASKDSHPILGPASVGILLYPYSQYCRWGSQVCVPHVNGPASACPASSPASLPASTRQAHPSPTFDQWPPAQVHS
jgi:hypothetical protein